jgi:hypothetical protein
MGATQLWYKKLLNDPALKSEYNFLDGKTKYSRASKLIEKHGK